MHSFAHTKREVEAAFGAPLLTRFSWFDPKPLASGSIAQVRKQAFGQYRPGAQASPQAASARCAGMPMSSRCVMEVMELSRSRAT